MEYFLSDAYDLWTIRNTEAPLGDVADKDVVIPVPVPVPVPVVVTDPVVPEPIPEPVVPAPAPAPVVVVPENKGSPKLRIVAAIVFALVSLFFIFSR